MVGTGGRSGSRRSRLALVRDRPGPGLILEFLLPSPRSCALRAAKVLVLTISTSRSKSMDPSGSFSPGKSGSRSYSVLVGRGMGPPGLFVLSKSKTTTTPLEPSGTLGPSDSDEVRLILPTATRRCTLASFITHRSTLISWLTSALSCSTGTQKQGWIGE
jgi:hypothetical protein